MRESNDALDSLFGPYDFLVRAGARKNRPGGFLASADSTFPFFERRRTEPQKHTPRGAPGPRPDARGPPRRAGDPLRPGARAGAPRARPRSSRIEPRAFRDGAGRGLTRAPPRRSRNWAPRRPWSPRATSA